ncbi:hypothetical protein ACHAXT_002375 [Thalassiosira profunda]
MSPPRPPPLPPPPPAIADEPATSQPPTFIEKWLSKEKGQSPPPNNTSTRQYFEKQCLFPMHIPSGAHCNVEPVVSLIAHHDLDGDGEASTNASDGSNTSTPAHRSTLDDVRKIAATCATYKSRALLNHNQFQYKRAMMLKAKRESEQSTAASDPTPGDSATALTPPPYHADYTPLSMPGNFLMAKIHSANYSLCLAGAFCPERTRSLVSCWRELDKADAKLMEQQGLEGFICLEEREAVERCVGLGVQRAMKDILG